MQSYFCLLIAFLLSFYFAIFIYQALIFVKLQFVKYVLLYLNFYKCYSTKLVKTRYCFSQVPLPEHLHILLQDSQWCHLPRKKVDMVVQGSSFSCYINYHDFIIITFLKQSHWRISFFMSVCLFLRFSLKQ